MEKIIRQPFMEWFCVQMVWKKDIKITVSYMESGKQQWPHVFPWKAKAAKRYKNSKEKKLFLKEVWCEQESEICDKESDIHHKVSHHTAITSPPSTLKRIQVHFFSPSPSTEWEGSSRSIYSTPSLFSAVSWYHMDTPATIKSSLKALN